MIVGWRHQRGADFLVFACDSGALRASRWWAVDVLCLLTELTPGGLVNLGSAVWGARCFGCGRLGVSVFVSADGDLHCGIFKRVIVFWLSRVGWLSGLF